MTIKREMGEAVLNAVVGDFLADQGNDLATKMALYDRGRPLETLPSQTSKICVLVHGMACNETCWTFTDESDRDYGRMLGQEYGLTPLYVRYNTGLPIWNNGQQLSALLQSLVEQSPEPIKEITLIGHSMGGLVIRSACHQGSTLPWMDRVRRAFYLASPHLGSPLEKAGKVVTSVLKATPEPVTKMIGNVADLRSAAVKDLGNGDLLETDHPVALDDRLEHFEAAAQLPGVAGHVLGDGLVRVKSAMGASGTEPSSNHRVELFADRHHMMLAHDPEVYAWMASHCGPADPREPAEPKVGKPRPLPVDGYRHLVQEAVDKGSSAVQEVHEAIAARPYDILEAIPAIEGPTRFVRKMHFGIMRGTYAAVRGVNQLVGAQRPDRSDPEPED